MIYFQSFIQINDNKIFPILFVSAEITQQQQQESLCDFIAATNINKIVNYEMWSCKTTFNNNNNKIITTTTNPCDKNSKWNGLICSENKIIGMNLSNTNINGK